MFGLRPGLFHPGRIITLRAEASKRKQEQLCESLGAGGKPSTWLPPGKLADLLNNSTIHVLCPHAHVIFLCVPRIPHARGDIRTLCNILSHSLVLPIAALVLFWAILSFFPCSMLSSHVTSAIQHALRRLLVCAQHSPCTCSFPKRSVIFLRVSVLFLIAVLLLSWAVVLYFSFHAQSHVSSDVLRALRHLLVCIQHSICV